MPPRPTTQRLKSFDEFWPFYLSQHSKPATRWIHCAGTLLACLLAIACLAAGKPAGLLAALLLGYGPAWFAHFFVERNRPATFQYPLWSLLADFKMAFLLLTGRL